MGSSQRVRPDLTGCVSGQASVGRRIFLWTTQPHRLQTLPPSRLPTLSVTAPTSTIFCTALAGSARLGHPRQALSRRSSVSESTVEKPALPQRSMAAAALPARAVADGASAARADGA